MRSRAPGIRNVAFLLLLLVIPLGVSASALAFQGGEKVSRFGEYQGYSSPEFDSYVRTSFYLTMRDGVRLAADIMRPAKGGQVSEEALPCVWTHTRYRRATRGRDGRVRCAADSGLNFSLIRHGYNLVHVDVRGSGASFGTWKGIFTKEETRDAYEITEWIAAQPWCDGNIGMTGGSYLGITQFMAASTRPPHLKALFPIVALYDLYDTAHHGGVFFEDFIRTWSELTYQLDTQIVAVGVDDDEGGALLRAAIGEHAENRQLVDVLGALVYRDDKDDVTGAHPYREWHPAGFFDEINEAKIPVYQWCGWFDSFTKDGFFMHELLEGPKKMAMGAWSHSPKDPAIAQAAFGPMMAEQLRWFDYWLKGIDNGVMKEDPITYHSMRGPKDSEWRTAKEWPPSDVRPVNLYFASGPSMSVGSSNDGVLSPVAPDRFVGRDEYTVDYSTTSGTTTRWDNAVGGGFGYPDMTANDAKSLTYTTAALPDDVDVTGHPVAHLWVSSTAPDGDFFVFLEEIDAGGKSHYVSEGTLRASCRKLHEPPNRELDFVPWHRCHETDTAKLTPGEAVELVVDLQPTSNIFDAGHRIRLTISCADADNARTPELSPLPTVTVHRNAGRSSFLSLPVVRSEIELRGGGR